MTLHVNRPSDGRERSTSVGIAPATDSPPSREQLEAVLENARRRAVVRRLLAVRDDERIAVGTLAADVADAEHDAVAVTTLLERRQRVHVSLSRTHLPLLESRGLASYDRERGLVSPGRELVAVEALLEKP